MKNKPPRLSLARLPTPLEPLNRLREVNGGPRIWVKRDDLTESGAHGNKIRKLEFTLAQAKAEHATALVTCGGLQSNHCRATALLGARLGFKVHLVLRGEHSGAAAGNLMLDQLAGATIHAHPAPHYRDNLEELLAGVASDLRAAGEKPFIIPTGASDEIGVWGYINAAAELMEDLDAEGIDIRNVVVATGSGGTQAGLTAGLHLAGSAANVWGMAVCDDADWFKNKVRQDLSGWQARYGVDIDIDALNINVDDRYIGPGYARATPEVFDTIGLVASTEGLVLDPVYTGKAFHGLLSECRDGRFRDDHDIVFVHTGGSFGLMAQAPEFAASRGGR